MAVIKPSIKASSAISTVAMPLLALIFATVVYPFTIAIGYPFPGAGRTPCTSKRPAREGMRYVGYAAWIWIARIQSISHTFALASPVKKWIDGVKNTVATLGRLVSTGEV